MNVTVNVTADLDLVAFDFVNNNKEPGSLVGQIYNSTKFEHENGELFTTAKIASFKVVSNTVYAETKYCVYRIRNLTVAKLEKLNSDANLYVHFTPSNGSDYANLLEEVFA